MPTSVEFVGGPCDGMIRPLPDAGTAGAGRAEVIGIGLPDGQHLYRRTERVTPEGHAIFAYLGVRR